ncbi:MAG: AraC family transcriptional regulator [Bacteroidota bacterium]
MQPSDIKKALSVYSWQLDRSDFFITQGISTSESFRINKELFRTNFHMLGLCTSGKIKMQINFKQYTVVPGMFMSVPPSASVSFVSKSKDFKVRMLLFEKSFLLKQTNNSELIETIGFLDSKGVTALKLNYEQTQLLIPLFNLVREKSESSDTFRDDIVRHLIFTLLYQCAGFYDNYTKFDNVVSSRKREIKNSFVQLVSKHCKEQHKLNFYADKLFITPKHLTETIKEETGKTAGTIIDETLLLEAKLLLNNKTKNIQEVSQVLHFASQTLFAKFFKRHSGFTPTEWRSKK